MSAANGVSPFLTREAILKSTLKQEVVDVPEWGGKLNVREMTAQERDRYEYFVRRGNDKNDPDIVQYRARAVHACVIDEHGMQIFEPGDIEALAMKSAAALDRVWNVILRISGIIEEKKIEPSSPEKSSSTDSASRSEA